MSKRTKLPSRRPTVTTTLEYNGSIWSVSVGFDPKTNQAKEVFVDGTKGELEGIVDDACVAVSRLLQYGETPSDIVSHFGGTDTAPASVIGMVARLIEDEQNKIAVTDTP